MGTKSNIVYQYFKKEQGEETIFFQFDPIHASGARLTVHKNGEMELEESKFDLDFPDQLKADGFIEANPLEFHILINGLR